jgi:NitT/TauT family transport system substrate-binding protein
LFCAARGEVGHSIKTDKPAVIQTCIRAEQSTLSLPLVEKIVADLEIDLIVGSQRTLIHRATAVVSRLKKQR